MTFSFIVEYGTTASPTNITLAATSITENQPSHATVGTLSTTDPDAGDTFTYTLVSGLGDADNASFTIVGNTLKTAASFDYETKSSYSIRVRSTDSVGLTFEKAITIAVADVNEAPTKILLSQLTVPENAPIGTVVGTLSAVDPDAGDTFTYAFVGGSSAGDNALFTIVGDELRTAAVFDYEARSSYSIRLRVTDAGGLSYPSITASAPVAFFDNGTYTDLTGESANLTASLTRLGYSRTAFSGLAAADWRAATAATNLLIIPELEKADLYPALSADTRTAIRDYVGAGGGLMMFTTRPGVGPRASSLLNGVFGFSIGGETELSASQSLNTAAAAGSVFSTGPTTLTAPNATMGVPTSSLPVGAKSLYQAGTSSSVFTATYGAGTIAVLGFDWFLTPTPTDWETVLGLAVTATRGLGEPFAITVTNVSDSNPTDIALSTSSVPENSPIGTTVGTFTTSDTDTGDTFTYSLVSGTGDADNASFTIVGNTLKTAASFDFETKKDYSIRVRTTDSTGLTLEKAITISVADINEYVEDFDPAVDAGFWQRIDEGTTGTQFTGSSGNALVFGFTGSGTRQAITRGFDLATGGTISFALIIGNSSNGGENADPGEDIVLEYTTDGVNFTIIKTYLESGYTAFTPITEQIPLAAQTANTQFRWRQLSHSGLGYDQWAIDTISIIGTIRAPTDISLFPSWVAENQPAGTTVGTLSTTDINTGDTFTYSLVSGTGDADNASFTIVGNTLKTAASFDFETKKDYSIRVRTTDSTGLTLEKAITISVADINEYVEDFDPAVDAGFWQRIDEGTTGTQFTGSSGNALVFGFTGSGTRQAITRGFDLATGGTISFALIIGNSSNGGENADPGEDIVLEYTTDGVNFTIIKTYLESGYTAFTPITEQIPLAAQTANTQFRWRQLSHSGLGYDQWAIDTISISAPRAPTDISLSPFSVPENSPIGTVVGTFTTTDPDAGDNFTYSLVAGTGDADNASFTIVGNELRTAASFDFETKKDYSIRVRTMDSAGLTFEKAIPVSVTNVNEAPTKILLSQLTVPENAPIGTVVGTLSAVDPDAGDTFTYAFVGGSSAGDNALFTIVGDELRTAAVFDYEARSSYSIRLRVTDAGGLSYPSITASAPIAYFDNGTYTDLAQESKNLAAALTTLGYSRTAFTGLAPADWATATAATTLMVIPELDLGDLNAALSADARTTIRNYVNAGGGLMVFQGQSGSIRLANLVNAVFGYSIGTASVSSAQTLNSTAAAGTPFTTGPASLETTSFISGVTTASLPLGAKALYQAGTATTVFTASYGQGVITWLGLDWASSTANWNTVLGLAVTATRGPTGEPFAITVTNVSDSNPTDIALSTSSVPENSPIGTTVGTFTTSDTDTGDTFTYTLVSGTGDADNASFTIVGNTLKTAASFDYEAKNSYSIRVRSEDSTGLPFEKAIPVSVTNVLEGPSRLTISNSAVAENQLAPRLIGKLAAGFDGLFSSLLVNGNAEEGLWIGTPADGFPRYSTPGWESVSGRMVAERYPTITDVRNIWLHSPGPADRGAFLFYGDTQALSIARQTIDFAPSASLIDADAVQYVLSGWLGGFADQLDDATVRVTFLDATSQPLSVAQIGPVTAGDRANTSSLLYRETSADLPKGARSAIVEIEMRRFAGGFNNGAADQIQLRLTPKQGYSLPYPDLNPQFTYTLVPGQGDDDNARFTIQDGQFVVAQQAFDYEDRSSFSIRVRATAANGLSYESALGIQVFNVDESPQDVVLSTTVVEENLAVGALVGTLTTIDPDGGDTVTYTLVTGTGDADNASFTIVGNELRTAASFDYETKKDYSIRVRTTDSTGLTFERILAVTVSDVADEWIIDVPFTRTVTDSVVRSEPFQLVKRGPGTLILDKANSHSGGTIIEVGEVIVRNLSALGTGTLQVRAGAKVTLDVGSVNWNGDTNFIQLSRLQLDPAGRLEVGTGHIRVASGGYDAASIRAGLITGRAGGDWQGGASGIGVTSAFAADGLQRAIGYRVMPSTNELRLGFAAFGDSNLDGRIDSTDITLINVAGRYGQGMSTSTTWAAGDFNYDGRVNSTDISFLNGTGLFGKGSYLPSPPASLSSSQTTSATGTISTDLWAAYALATESKTVTKKR